MREKDEARLKKIGLNLARIRKDQGLSQRDLSYKCDVDYGKISKIETGKANLYVTTLLELAEGLGVNAKELLEI